MPSSNFGDQEPYLKIFLIDLLFRLVSTSVSSLNLKIRGKIISYQEHSSPAPCPFDMQHYLIKMGRKGAEGCFHIYT